MIQQQQQRDCYRRLERERGGEGELHLDRMADLQLKQKERNHTQSYGRSAIGVFRNLGFGKLQRRPRVKIKLKNPPLVWEYLHITTGRLGVSVGVIGSVWFGFGHFHRPNRFFWFET